MRCGDSAELSITMSCRWCLARSSTFCGSAISLSSRRLGLAGSAGAAAGAGGGVHSSGSSGSELPQNCFICLASVPTRASAAFWDLAVLARQLSVALAARDQQLRRHSRSRERWSFSWLHALNESRERRTSLELLLVGGCPRKPQKLFVKLLAMRASSMAAGLVIAEEVIFGQPHSP